MLRGLYVSGVGMQAQINRMDILSNNLANVDTAAFKRDATATRSFTDELTLRIHGEDLKPFPIQPWPLERHGSHIGRFSSGVFVDEVYTDFSMGNLRAVGDQYTMAISGPGFFTVRIDLPNGDIADRYTRDGSFTLDARGMLVTKDGGMVLGLGEVPIYIPQGAAETTINVQGHVIVNNQVIGQLLLADFDDYTTLRKIGNNYFATTAQTLDVVFSGSIIQGYVEESNINAVREIVEVINAARIYEANSRFVQVIDQTLGQAVNEIARK